MPGSQRALVHLVWAQTLGVVPVSQGEIPAAEPGALQPPRAGPTPQLCPQAGAGGWQGSDVPRTLPRCPQAVPAIPNSHPQPRRAAWATHPTQCCSPGRAQRHGCSPSCGMGQPLWSRVMGSLSQVLPEAWTPDRGILQGPGSYQRDLRPAWSPPHRGTPPELRPTVPSIPQWCPLSAAGTVCPAGMA